jgi:ribosomal protein S18 acetylase RimI-like enzyme
LGGYLHHDGAEGEPELHRLYVDPQRKRGGIGSALMQALHELLRLDASYFLFVHAANADAISFYERHGLVQEARLEMTYPGLELAEDTPPSLVLRACRAASVFSAQLSP